MSRLMLGLALALGTSSAQAAVTARGAFPDEGPRAGWLDRFAEARQGPETVDKVSQTFKVGADGSLDLTGISGEVRITGGGGGEIKVDATKRVRHRDPEQAKRLIAELRVDMTQRQRPRGSAFRLSPPLRRRPRAVGQRGLRGLGADRRGGVGPQHLRRRHRGQREGRSARRGHQRQRDRLGDTQPGARQDRVRRRHRPGHRRRRHHPSRSAPSAGTWSPRASRCAPSNADR